MKARKNLSHPLHKVFQMRFSLLLTMRTVPRFLGFEVFYETQSLLRSSCVPIQLSNKKILGYGDC
jgi:hypothetical protein